MRHRRARGDRGAALVEFAFVAPLLFLVMFALADFALAELSDAAGANAAREGARVGILYYDGAHTAGANRTKIVDAVSAKLAGNVEGTPTVTVRCLNPNGTARPGGGSCSTVGTDTVDVGQDLIEVSVTWTRKGGITGLVPSPTRTDKAQMRIVGQPPTGSAGPPTACAITAASANPSTVVRTGASLPAITFSVSVNDAALCGTPLLDLTAEAGYGGAQTMTSTGPTAFELTMPAGQGSWTSGAKTVVASANGGSVTANITFTVNDPAVCLITSASASPSAVTHSGGALTSSVGFTVVVSDAGTCGTPTLTFPGNAGYAGPQTMTSAGGNTFTFTHPASQGIWASQTYTITAAATGGGGDTEPISLVVTAAPTCTLSNLTITPSSAPVKRNGQQEIQAQVTIRVTRSSSTACVAPTVTVTPGSSGPAGSATDLTTPKTMRNVGTTAACTGLTCEWVIDNGTRSWMPAPSSRTVTVTASGSTVTGTLTLT